MHDKQEVVALNGNGGGGSFGVGEEKKEGMWDLMNLQ
jgi:hypothetical protein